MTTSEPATEGGWAGRALYTLAMLSGFGSIVYEVLYVRHLTNLLGDMYYVHATLIGTFLLGIGIGSKVAHRFRRQLHIFEGLIGAYAWSFSFIVTWYEGSPLHGLVEDPVWQTVLSTSALLSLPSIAIGFSVPLFSAYLDEFSEKSEGFFDTYLLYNLGACLSILLFELLIIRLVGYTMSLRILGAVNIAVAMVLFAGRGRWFPVPEGGKGSGEGSPTLRRSGALLLASLGAAVFHGFYLKLAYLLFSPHRENFAICTSAVLLGIAVGTDLVHRHGIRFQSAVAGAVASLGLVYAVFPWIEQLYGMIPPLYFTQAVVTKILFALLLGGIPYVCLGATIPALVRQESDADVARRSGHYLFLSGVANAAGFVLYLFVVHPNLSFFTAIPVVAVLLCGALLVFGREHLAMGHLAAVACGLAFAVATWSTPESEVYVPDERSGFEGDVTHFKSASDNVTLAETEGGGSWLSYNGHPSIRVRAEGHRNVTEIVSGTLPAFFAPSRDRALVLGLGSGLTGGATATLFEQTDIVELNGAFLELAPKLGEANFEVADNAGATLIHDDARRYLVASAEKYDAIVNSIPAPTYYSAGKIYTREFFQRIGRALKPGGTYSTWFSFGNMSRQGIETLLGTLHAEFENCNLAVLRLGYYLATCSEEPLEMEPPEKVELPAELAEAIGTQVPGRDLELYLTSVILSPDVFAHTDFRGAASNRDAFPILEFQLRKFQESATRLDHSAVEYLEKLNLQVEVPAVESRAFLLKALIYRALHPPIYERYFAPKIEADDERRRAFEKVRKVFDEQPGTLTAKQGS